ncbi:hypothetical protein C5Y96_05380 [Blastopirellula marina]|uniref:Uncharacterized protein n=1 Tax=Blastopirellula marina TaxID=124 RepID=A0A2S8G4C9_9BACT|nr:MULTISPECIES: hypothetical protein [Pirellulaceae]PQO39287.1 hypothetical protein C5Y96_05380 [Blastopirellula marina]RCS55595.1 hypothetical protein DTL36_05390 [Bremerella cremea]
MASDAQKSNSRSVHHLVVQRVEEARRGAMRRVRLRGTAWGLAAGLLLLLGMALFDYLLRQDDFGTRWFLSLVTLGGLVFAVVWWIIPAWKWAPSLQQIAQRIEQFFPELRDKISSALFFLEQDEEDAAGSSAYFRRKHIAEMADTLTYTDLSVALNRHLATKAIYALGGVVFVFLSVLLFSPQQFGTAVSRLAMPWSTIEWPRQNNLALIDPPKIVPLGGRAVIEVEDLNHNLPAMVELQVRYESDGQPMTHPMQLDLQANRMVYQLDGIQRAFEFRVEGGDDDTMTWHAVDVVKPPKFSDVQVTLVPPEYTRWLPSQSPRSIIALEGTTTQLFGKVDQKITQAEFVFEANGKSEVFPLVIGEDGYSFSTPPEGADNEPAQGPILAASGNYWIEVTVESGLKKAEGRRFPVRVIADKPPIVSWVQPDRNMSLTLSALLDLSAGVRDDLQTQDVKLIVKKQADSTVLIEQSLFTGPEERPFESAPSNLAMGLSEDLEITHSLDFSQLEGLTPGTILELTITATDYRPQTGTSLPRIITIISQEQLDQRVNRQQREIISKIAEARRLQQDARQQTRSVEIKLEEGSQLGPAELANLQNGEQNQKNVREKLVAGRDSAAKLIDQLLDELKQNRQTDHDASEILQDLQEKIQSIADSELTPIESEITQLRRQTPRGSESADKPSGKNTPAETAMGERSGENNSDENTPDNESGSDSTPTRADKNQPNPEENAAKPDSGTPDDRDTTPTGGEEPSDQPMTATPATEGSSESNEQDPKRTQQQLDQIGKRQEKVAGQLQDWQNDLNKWDTFRRFAMDVRDLANRQKDLEKRTEEKQAETIGQDVERMSPEDRADLKQMAEEQTDLAGELDRIQSRMRDMMQNDPESEEVANTLKDAINENRDAAVSQRMRQAGQRIEQNQLSSAKESQQQVEKSLEDVLDTLQNRRETDKKELKRKLDEAQQELEELQDRQKELQRKAEEAQMQSGDMGNQQSPQSQQRKLENLKQQANQLKEQAERLARKLERLTAQKAAEKVRDAAERLEEAAKNAQNMDTQQLQDEIDQAQKDLEEAQQELEDRQEQVEQDLAQEQAAKLKQSIEQLIIRQTRIRDELVRLDEIKKKSGQLSQAQKQTLEGISLEQATLTDEIRSFAESIAKAEVYHLSLQLTAEVTTDLSRLLDTGEIDARMLSLADEAVQRLEQLIAAMEEEEKQQGSQDQQQDDQQQQDQGDQQQQQQGSQDGISQTAQLRLLKMMQEALKSRTQTLGERIEKKANEADQAELSRLAAEQGRLSEMTLNLIKNTEEEIFDPENLPDIEPTEPADADQEEENDV